MKVKTLYEKLKIHVDGGRGELPIRFCVGDDKYGKSIFVDFTDELWIDQDENNVWFEGESIEQKQAKFMLIALD